MSVGTGVATSSDGLSASNEASISEEYFNLKTLIIGLVCLLGAASGSTLLYLDFTHSGTAGFGEPIAWVEKKDSKVRRKPSQSYAWENVEENQELYERESIQTGSQSAALIRLKDGSKIELGENSLIVIEKTAKLALNYLQGTMVLRDEAGTKKVTKDLTGETKIEEIPTQLLKPEPLASFFSKGSAKYPITFEWVSKSVTSAEKTLEISTDVNFIESKTQKISLANHAKQQDTTSISLPAGQYFWKITSAKTTSEIGKFKITRVNSLEPVFPIKGEKIIYWGQDSSISFRWLKPQTNSTDASHVIEVSKSSTFNELAIQEPIVSTTETANIKGLSQGTYFWRIKSKYNTLEILSNAEKFTVEQAKKVSVKTMYPESGTTMELLPQLTFQWSSDADNVEFQIEVRTIKDDVVVKQSIKVPVFAWESPQVGSYKWRVTALWNNKVSTQTEWEEFTLYNGQPLTLRTPEDTSKIYYLDTPKDFDFEWSKDSLVKQDGYSYRLQIAIDSTFKNIVAEHKTTDVEINAAKLSLKAGAFFWRVQVISTQNNKIQIIKTSPAFSFTYGVKPVLPAPAVKDVPNNWTYNPVKEKKHPVLKWNEVAGAEYYEVTVYKQAPVSRSLASDNKDKTNSTPIKNLTVKGTSYEFQDYTEQTYHWSVRAIDSQNRKGESSPVNTINISFGNPLGSPEVVSPEIQ